MPDKPSQFSSYYDREAIERSVAAGQHRDLIGGLWDEIGALQLEFLKARGLRPHHKLLDVGCGSLRGGVHFVRYMEPANYFGVDLNRALLDAGYDPEITTAGLVHKLPKANLHCTGEFDVGVFGVVFDFALALSVFTHLPLNSIRVCLERTVDVIAPGGMLFATIFELPEDQPSWLPRIHPPANIRTHAAADPYHYRLSDLCHAAGGLPWTVHAIGDFQHPRGQRMVAFERV